MYSDEKKLQEKFIAVLKEKIPRHLAGHLMEMLPLEKEAVYRRLRSEVPFSFFEIAILSSSLSISLDNIADIMSPYRSQWYHLHLRDYCEYRPIDMNMSDNYIKAIHMAANDPNSEFGIAANVLPLHIALLHVPLYRVYLLKWKYQFSKAPQSNLSYADIQEPEAEKKTYQQYLDAVKKVKHTFFIWDNSFILSLINDINYFHNIRMISRSEMQMLKREIYRLLDTLEYFADEGQYDTGNRVETYVSDLDFDTTYTYLSSENISISMNSVYSLGAFTSLEKEACEEMKNWVLGLKKSSVLISGAAQYTKIMFFEKQKDLLEKRLIIAEND